MKQTVQAITAERLTRLYGHRVGIEDVRFDVPEGQIFGFLGPNGSGKTTTIRLLLGFLRPSFGQATIFGWDCWQQSDRLKHDVGYLPGDLRLYSWMTARSALKISGLVRGRNLMTEGGELADRFRLEMDLRVQKMSRGTRQKLGLILALAHKPRLLILDEPTTGLDPMMQDELAAYLRQMAAQGNTVFFSSHTLSEVEQWCHRVAIIRDGRIVADDLLETLRKQARRTAVLTFADDDSACQVIPPTFLSVTRRDGQEWQCEFTGPAAPLIRWAARHPIEDIQIGLPDLDTLFRGYYRLDRDTT